jgi:ribosome biogenesis protein SSF1/2
MRDLMYPYTATKLKESKKNSLKDFISVAGMYGVTHMMLFT